MSDLQVSKQIFIGLPSTGKTTFLAALWHVVNTTEVPGALSLDKLHSDVTYLNKIRSAWLAFQEIARTPIGTMNSVSMRLRSADGIAAELLIPDVSGEMFALSWSDRKWPKHFDAFVQDATGALLFIHPEHVSEPTTITMVEHLVNELGPETNTPTPCPNVDIVSWHPNLSPTQVQLVDILQMIESRSAVRPFKLSVIVSAWDLVEHLGQDPQTWVERRLPLLFQFIRANAKVFKSAFYGISALGASKENLEQFHSAFEQAKRIQVNGKGCQLHDLTAPIKWVAESLS